MKKIITLAFLATSALACKTDSSGNAPPIEDPGCPCGGHWGTPVGAPGSNHYSCDMCVAPPENDPDRSCCTEWSGNGGAETGYFEICPGDAAWPEECGGYVPPGVATAGDGVPGDGGGFDTEGGLYCDGHFVSVDCHGWAAGVYRTPSGGGFLYSFTPGGVRAECVDFGLCVPDVGEYQDSVLLQDACRDACEEMLDAGELPMGAAWPASVGGWTKHHTSCVMGGNGNLGMIPAAYEGIGPAIGPLPDIDTDADLVTDSGFCPNIMNEGNAASPQKDDVTFVGCAADEMCLSPEVDYCTDWVPGGLSGNQKPEPTIATATNTTTKIVTVSMPKLMLTQQLDDGFSRVYSCDVDDLYDVSNSIATNWKFVSLAALGWWYEIGFRNNDHLVRVREKTGTSTFGPWLSLESDASLLNVYSVLKNASAFQIEFKRGSPTSVTYTMNVTLT